MMMKIRLLLVLLIVTFPITLSAMQGLPPSYFAENMDMMLQPNIKNMTYEEQLTQVQAYMLKSLFIKPMMNDQSISIITDDDDEEDIVPQSFHMQNDILSQVMAEHLAKQDILGFNKKYKAFLR